MFVQVIQGKVRDADLLRRQVDAWRSEVKPNAAGYLGSTSGVTEDGVAVVVARFESEAAARKNSERAEQGAWWEQTAPAFEGEVRFLDCSDVDLIYDGGSNGAGFVQIMQGRAVDPVKLRAMGRTMEDDLRAQRPDVLGGVVGWHGDREFTQVMYFSSEQEAREAEAKMTDDPQLDEWGQMLDGPITFLDLRNPDFD
jgi:hypothetical protein